MEKNEAQGAGKRAFRQEALTRRELLTKEQREEAGRKILKKLTALPIYQEADGILTYVSFRSEVDTFLLIRHAWEAGKAVFAPKVSGRDMEFFRICSMEDLREGYRGILEPCGMVSCIDWISQNYRKQKNLSETAQHPSEQPRILVCMPGAVFDRECRRIGYGGGFYDRYLTKAEENITGKITRIALAFDCQMFEKIPWEAHDICPHCIITEKEMIWQSDLERKNNSWKTEKSKPI